MVSPAKYLISTTLDCRDWHICLASTAEGITLGVRYGLAQVLAWNHCTHGWALAHTGKTAEGLAELQRGMENSAHILGQIAMPLFCAMLAEVLMLRGDHARALEEIQQRLTLNETSRDLYVNAELHRLAGECQLALGEPEAAESSLQRAIETARGQGAKTFELRAASALGRLWAARNQRDRARTLLQTIYDALGDAEDTVDVLRARACLREWS
jgi:tetratricopeptide (TPR) repeat protein